MNYKDAYYVLLDMWTTNKENENYPSFDDINEAFAEIFIALSRLENIEKGGKKDVY